MWRHDHRAATCRGVAMRRSRYAPGCRGSPFEGKDAPVPVADAFLRGTDGIQQAGGEATGETGRDGANTAPSGKRELCGRARVGALLSRSPRHPAMLATILVVLAGFLDAVGYVELHHLYVSFMSGNSTQLGIALAAASWRDVLAVLTIVGSFVAGACVGTRISDAAGSRRATTILVVELFFLAIASGFSMGERERLAMTLVAFVMGMQNTLHQVVAGADIGKGFITGTLFGLGEALARVFRTAGSARSAAFNFLSWFSFVSGTAVGTLALSWFGLKDCLSAAAVTIAAVLAGLLTGRV